MNDQGTANPEAQDAVPEVVGTSPCEEQTPEPPESSQAGTEPPPTESQESGTLEASPEDSNANSAGQQLEEPCGIPDDDGNRQRRAGSARTEKAAHDKSEQVNRVDKTQEMVNVQDAPNSNFYFVRERPKEEPEELQTDPAQDLPSRPSDYPSGLVEAEKAEILRLLPEERMVVLHSVDGRANLIASYDVLESPEFKAFGKKSIPAVSLGDDSAMDSVIDRVLAEREHVIVVVEAKSFNFERLCRGQLLVGHFKDRLRASHSYILALVEEDIKVLECRAGDTRCISEAFKVVSIPFLAILLRLHYDAVQAETVRQRLESQRRKGLWTKGSDREWHLELCDFLNHGSAELDKEIERRESDGVASAGDSGLEGLLEASRDDRLLSTVLFVAAYFPGLAPHEFNLLVSLLVQGETVEKVEKKQDGDEEIQISKQVPLTELWEQRSDRLLAQCRLEACGKRRGHCLEFVRLSMREQIRQHIESKQPMLLLNHFGKLQKSGVFFRANNSRLLSRTLVHLSVERTLQDPDYYGHDWLIRFVLGLQSNITIREDASAKELMDAVIRHFHEKRYFINRLSDLICVMLRHRQLYEMVDKFLGLLVDLRRHQEVLDLVLEVFRRLFFAREFNALCWCRRLADEGGEDARRQVGAYTFRMARISGLQVYEYLAQLKEWVPDNGRDGTMSPSRRIALYWAYRICTGFTRTFPVRSYGVWPSRFVFFRSLTGERERDLECLASLAEWLLHPDLPGVVAEFEDLHPEEAEHSLAAFQIPDLLEVWAWILLGEGVDEAPAEAQEMLDPLSRQFASRMTAGQRNKALHRWLDRRAYCRKELAGVPRSNKTDRQKARFRFECLGRLRRLFLKSQSSEPA